MASDLLPITLPEMLAELEREIALRKRVYPRWVQAGRLSAAKAERQIEVMEQLAEYLKGITAR